MKLLDLCCCQGGASQGYVWAGFTVTGVDNIRQPRYPFKFIKADALNYLAEHGHEYDVIAGSPPCQAHTRAQQIQGNHHDDLIPAMRELMNASGKPWVIENVVGAPLIDPILLCGATFGLRTYRHRLFESNVPLVAPKHRGHVVSQVKMGRAHDPLKFYQAVGNFSGVAEVKRDMKVEWMSREGVRESIPPAYTAYIGHQMRAWMENHG